MTTDQITKVLAAIRAGRGHEAIDKLSDADQIEIANVLADHYYGRQGEFTEADAFILTASQEEKDAYMEQHRNL